MHYVVSQLQYFLRVLPRSRDIVLKTITILQVAGDERRKCTNPRVYTRLSRASTTASPRNNANKSLGRVHNRAAAVTLARVLTTAGDTSTEHAVSDCRSRIVVAASSAGNDRHINLAESGRRVLTTFGLVSPGSGLAQ